MKYIYWALKLFLLILINSFLVNPFFLNLDKKGFDISNGKTEVNVYINDKTAAFLHISVEPFNEHLIALYKINHSK